MSKVKRVGIPITDQEEAIFRTFLCTSDVVSIIVSVVDVDGSLSSQHLRWDRH